MNKLIIFFILMIVFQSCIKIEYEKKELTYSIESDSGQEIKMYYYTGNNNTKAKVFTETLGDSKWNTLYVSPFGRVYSIIVESSQYDIQIISIKDKTIQKL